MIQDIAPHTYRNEYRPAPPEGKSYVLAYDQGKIFIKGESGLDFLRFQDLEGRVESLYKRWIYLFSIDQDRFYLIPGLDLGLFLHCRLEELRFLRNSSPKYLAFAGVTGFQLSQWYEKRRFCGCCGEPMVHSQKERMMYCPRCQNMEYPNLSPAVIVAVTKGEELLLTKYEGRGHTRYALIAGYAEIGETIEETIHREVMEEVGLKVKNFRYYKSQPWSFSGTLLFGFFCDLDGDDAITLDREELALAKWFRREDIPDEGEDISLTKEMMMVFKRGEA